MQLAQNNIGILTDSYGRKISYLRISITDRCDFRCLYCMSDDMQFLPRSRILSLDEIFVIAKAFVSLGVEKIRITGGEPLVRKDCLSLMHKLGKLKKLKELTITTNGSQLGRFAKELKVAGVKRINISLDSLDRENFKRLTRTGKLEQVLSGIQAAREAGFERIKINAVIIKNRNHREIINLANYAIENNFDITFIEEMPLGITTDHNRKEAYYSSDEVRQDLAKVFSLEKSAETTGGPANYYKISQSSTRIGFISPHSHNFCGDCNRVRLTAEGQLLLCLGQENSVDLKKVVREKINSPFSLERAILRSMSIKPLGHSFEIEEKPMIFRHMSHTGG